MKKTANKTDPQSGFSLIEIIMTLIIAAFLGSIFITYLGTSLIKSAEPVIKVQQGYSLNQVMESMTADYKRLLIVDNTPLATFKTYVENGNIPESDPYYGVYTVVTKYVTFTGGAEDLLEDTVDLRLLKVTVTNNDQSLAAIFTK